MPYIPQKRRTELDDYVSLLISALEDPSDSFTAGELNYVITKIMLAVWNVRPSYTNAAHIVGILETLKLEYYRRAVVPYEEEKREENGDVY